MPGYLRMLAVLATLLGLRATAQKAADLPDTSFHPSQVFFPVCEGGGSLLRASDGRPGPRYWQNRADYRIRASFDTLTHVLRAEETITYVNNSPVSLPYLWMLLAQNRFRKGSQTSLLTPLKGTRFGIREYTEGYVFQEVGIYGDRGHVGPVAYQVVDDHLKLTLPAALRPGQRCRLLIRYSFQLPSDGSDLMGILSTPEGSVFEFSDWYPRMAVYDDLRGWNTAPVFYGEPGSMDYYLTLPANMIAGGSGRLVRPSEVLSPLLLQRYRQAEQSDTPVLIRTPADVRGDRALRDHGTLTWHFQGDNISSANWAASASFCWDAACMRLPGGRTAMAMTLYPSAYQHRGWESSTREMKRQIEAYSRQWYPYPFPAAVSIAGRSTGLAGAGVAFISAGTGSEMVGITAKSNHEMGHAWFPFIVCVNGLHNWMCEGFDSFINDVNGDSLHIQTAFSHDIAMDWLTSRAPVPPIVTLSPFIDAGQVAMTCYIRPAMALRILRNEVIGPGRFDDAFRGFIHAWAFRHPSPEDFFRCMENASGEDLSWFWRSWFFYDWKLDQAIASVRYTNDDPARGIDVTIVNKERIVMPVCAEIRQFNGDVDRVHLPVRVWLHGNAWTFHYPSVSAASVTLDPDHALPDLDRSNNSGGGERALNNPPSGHGPREIVDRYLEVIGGRKKLELLQGMEWHLFNPATKGKYYYHLDYYRPDSMSLVTGYRAARRAEDSVLVGNGVTCCWSRGRALVEDPARQEGLNYAMLPFPELVWQQPGYSLAGMDSAVQVNGMRAYRIIVTTPSGDRWEYDYDLDSGLKIHQEHVGGALEGSMGESTDYAQYLPEKGVLMPHTMIINRPGECEILRTDTIRLITK